MAIELSREQFPTVILYDWEIGLNYRERHVRLVAAWGAKHLQIEQFLTDFMNANVENWTFLIHLVLDDFALQQPME